MAGHFRPWFLRIVTNDAIKAAAKAKRLLSLDATIGEMLQSQSGSGGDWASSYQSRMVFPTIPPDVIEAALVVPCLQGTSPAAAPENWEIGLRFIPTPTDLAVMPILELSETQESSVPKVEEIGSGLYLDEVIELEDSYILAGSFQQGADFPRAMVMGVSLWPEIVDANGQTLPFTIPSDLDLVSGEPGVFPWGYETRKGFMSPLTIELEAVDVEFPVDASFQFNAGREPRVGQEWTLDQTFDPAGHAVKLYSAVRLDYGCKFNFRSDASVFGISIEDTDHVPVGGFGGGQEEEFSAGID
jgi:hypothetical protein